MALWTENRTRSALLAVAIGATVVCVGTAGMLAGREPFATWYYVFAWYGTLLATDGMVALVRPRSSGFVLLGRPVRLCALLGWSIVTWLFFELLNLRLKNWYYVFVPDDPLARWAGISLSFATVLPAVILSEAALEAVGVGSNLRSRRMTITPRLLNGCQLAGGVMLILVLAWPRLFFPLAWGFATLILDPANFRRDPARSLLGDLERGRPGRIVRLLLGGAAIGFLWELFNIGARGKWIYTVPGLEDFKLFEMPVLGFLGFPPFALECFAIWQALVLSGLAAAREEGVRSAPLGRRLAAVTFAVAFGVAVMLAMERYTISSYTPRLYGLPEVPVEELRDAGYDAFSLAEAAPLEVSDATGLSASAAERAVRSARLATLRGIGTENARRLAQVGVGSVDDLASVDTDSLVERLNGGSGRRIPPARVRVWVRAAREAVAAR